VTASRKCLGNPKKIKTAGFVSKVVDSYFDEDGEEYFEDELIDDVSPSKYKTPAWTKWLAYH